MYCPLYCLDDQIVHLLLTMSKMKKPLNVSDGLKLVNDIIEGTIHQKNLISWKLKRNCYYKNKSDLGHV